MPVLMIPVRSKSDGYQSISGDRRGGSDGAALLVDRRGRTTFRYGHIVTVTFLGTGAGRWKGCSICEICCGRVILADEAERSVSQGAVAAIVCEPRRSARRNVWR